MVDLLKDFLRALGLTVGPEGTSVFSVCISCWSVSGRASPISGVDMLGDRSSVRGDLFGGRVLGLVEERLLADRFTEFTFIHRDRTEPSSNNTVTIIAEVILVC